MLLYPNAKINIGLQITGKRGDGYHELRTIFYPLQLLTDTLSIEKSDSFSFCTKGLPTDCAESDNLVVRTYELFREHFGIGAVAIELEKLIPMGAGLGGGSADATFTAIGLNELFRLDLTQEQIARIVRPLGADCAFFAYNTPCFADGIGDHLTPYDLELRSSDNAQSYTLAVVKPDVHVSTAQAYSRVQIKEPDFDLHDINTLYINQWNGKVVNDFEQSVFGQFPEIAYVKQRLLEEGAEYAAMSGSGAAVFALFPAKGNLHAAITRYNLTHIFPGCFMHTEGFPNNRLNIK